MSTSTLSVADLSRMDAARLAAQVLQTRAPRKTADDKPSLDDSEKDFLDVRILRQQYMDWLANKIDEIEEQKEARRYYHGAHLTADELRTLRARHQPPQVWNRINRKINGIVGLVERMRSDPKAQPRSPKSEAGAEIAMRSIRYVLDEAEFKTLDFWALLQTAIDGVGGVQLIPVRGDKGDVDISLAWVVGDEYFYTPTNYRLNFDGQRYEGISKWYELDEAIDIFPEQEDLLRGLIEGDSDLTTNSDRDYKWVMMSSKRLRIVEHWYKHRGTWRWAFYCSTVLIDQGVSPFYDGKSESISSFVMFSAGIDQDGDRYGFVRNLKGPQQALNQGKSKMLHIANSRRLIMEKGAVDDVEIARREWSRPDGVIEVNPGKNVKPDDSRADLSAFASFTEDAKNELDQFGNTNIAAMAAGNVGNLSGRAVELLRQPGMAELGPFVLAYRAWKLQLYRAVWSSVQRYWNKERWIRINDESQGLAQFIQINGLGLDQWGRPAIVNAVGSIDVNIVLEEGPDVASMMQETFDALKGYPPGTFPPAVLIEFSPLPRSEKDRLLAMMAPKPPQQNPMQMEVARLSLEGLAGKNAKQAAETHKTLAAAEQARATADEKRAKTHATMRGAELDTASFVHDALSEAARVERETQPPPQPSPQQQGMPQLPAMPPLGSQR